MIVAILPDCAQEDGYMAQHRVTFTLPDLELGKADIRFQVRRSALVLGTLLLSKGAVVWRSKWQPGRGGKRLSWKDFDELMRVHGKPERRRRRGRA
jgi:hypothetical protein